MKDVFYVARIRPSPAIWLAQHRLALQDAWRALRQAGLGSLMTLLVIAVSLALPAALLALLEMGDNLTLNWQQENSITVFLQQEVDAETALTLAASMAERADVKTADILTSGDALEEFRRYSGFGDVLAALSTNPLPHQILVTPLDSASVDEIRQLASELQTLPESATVDYDQDWILRLNALLQTGKRLAHALAVGLAIAVIMIIGNTIRLEILNRHSEIEIAKLVGATDAYIRRPFLYTGLLYGALGASVSWLLVALLLLFIWIPLGQLEALYATQLTLRPFSLLRLGQVVPAGLLLGILGAWLAVGRQLKKIRPD